MPNFETFTRQRRPRSARARVACRRSGVIVLDHEAFALMQRPDAVSVRYTRATGLLELRSVEQSSPDAHRVTHATGFDAGSYNVRATSFLAAHPALAETLHRFDAVLRNGVLYVSVTSPAGAA